MIVLNRDLSKLLIPVLLLLAISGLGITSWTHGLRRQHRLLLSQRSYPYLLSGLIMDSVLSYADVIESSGDDSLPVQQRLLIVIDDTCQACSRMLPRLLAVLATVPWRPTQEVVVLSFSGTRDGERIRQVLAKTSAGFRLLNVREPQVITTATGIVSTPLMAILDSNYAIRLLARDGSDEELALVKSTLSTTLAPQPELCVMPSN